MRTDTEHRSRRGRGARGVPALAAGCLLALAAGTGCAGTGQGGGEREAGEPTGAGRGGTEPGARPLAWGDVAAEERGDLEAVFSDAGVEGTFALYDTGARELTVVGPEAARERAVPASTFTLANTLIGLQTGAVGELDEVPPRGGAPRPVPEWERDVSPREALSASSLPLHQELARRIGHERMAAWVDRFDYGNRSVGGADSVDRFWLDGPLEISAVEQTEFLAALARAELPVETGHQRALGEAAAVEEGGDYTLHVGGGPDEGAGTGWWVGWVERGGEVHTFALRIEVEEDGDAGLREPLAREMLVELGVLPAEAAGE